MSDRFSICHAITAKWEGGWSDHPADPGGKTMYGVTEAVYHAWLKRQGKALKPVRNITMAEALAIYRAEYWAPTAERYNLVPGVDLATYDAGVNAGVSRAVRWLMGAVGGPDHETVKKICAARLSFKQGLAIWKSFGRGWTNRVVDVEAKGVKMALEAKAEKPAVQQKLEEEAKAADRKAKAQGTGAAGSGAGAGGGTQVAPEQVAPVADQLAGWMLTGAIVALLLVGAFLAWRAYINRKRAKAYEKEARG